MALSDAACRNAKPGPKPADGETFLAVAREWFERSTARVSPAQRPIREITALVFLAVMRLMAARGAGHGEEAPPSLTNPEDMAGLLAIKP